MRAVGFIYAVRWHQYYKVGRTWRLKARLSALQIAIPERLGDIILAKPTHIM